MAETITDFEETRRCLVNTYHDYVQNHVGYLMAIVISLVGFSTYQTIFENFFSLFLSKNLINPVSTIVIVLTYVGVVFFVYRRIKYWTRYANTAITLPENYAIKLFKEYYSDKNQYYSEQAPAPNTAILQRAISQEHWHLANDKMLYVKCKTKECGLDFATDIKIDKKSFKTKTLVNKEHTCPRKHTNKYNKAEYHFKNTILGKFHLR